MTETPKPAEMPDEIYALCHEAYEVYAGMEGGIPETAYEGFLLQHIEEMAKIIGKAKSICLTRASATAGKAELVPEQLIKEIIAILNGVVGYWTTGNDLLPTQEEVEQAIATLEDFVSDEFDMEAALDKAEWEKD